MKVLISGGIKTKNIVESLEKKFSSSGVEFEIVNNIEDIYRVFSNGGYFDRAIIIENSWTHDNKDIYNEKLLRERINKFSSLVEPVLSDDVNCIFIARTSGMAELVSEETVDIFSYSVIIENENRFSV